MVTVCRTLSGEHCEPFSKMKVGRRKPVPLERIAVYAASAGRLANRALPTDLRNLRRDFQPGGGQRTMSRLATEIYSRRLRMPFVADMPWGAVLARANVPKLPQ